MLSPTALANLSLILTGFCTCVDTNGSRILFEEAFVDVENFWYLLCAGSLVLYEKNAHLRYYSNVRQVKLSIKLESSVSTCLILVIRWRSASGRNLYWER